MPKNRIQNCTPTQYAYVCIQAQYNDVCQYALEIFKKKFDYFEANINKMDALFKEQFRSVAEDGKRLSRY